DKIVKPSRDAVTHPGFQPVKKVRLVAGFFSRLKADAPKSLLFGASVACGRVIVARRGTLTVPPHTPPPSVTAGFMDL
ncbi:MAG: hypothetical protein IJZ13_09510, partial [Clostridia bacterium]|nr:hypothetical protein [Clostridia bacterium]